MCMEEEVKINQTQLNIILLACKTINTISTEHELLKQEQGHLKEKINKVEKDRKEDVDDMKNQFINMENEINNKFEIMNASLKSINKWIIGSLSGILGSVVISIILFFIGKATKWW